jgi:type VI secretion system secreted protein Hcp
MALFDAFLKIADIPGESADTKHKSEIDVESFSFEVQQHGTQGVGTGGGAGKASFQDIHFVKKIDKSSPILLLSCASGKHIKEATLTVRKAGGEQLEYLKIKLTDVLVSSYSHAGAQHAASQASAAVAGGSGATDNAINWGDYSVPVDQFSLNFAKIEMQYQPQGADGKAQGGALMAGWNVKENKKV